MQEYKLVNIDVFAQLKNALLTSMAMEFELCIHI